jgi:hypothetical protein
LNHVDVEAVFSVNARVFGDEKGEKGEAEGRIAHANFLELLTIGAQNENNQQPKNRSP